MLDIPNDCFARSYYDGTCQFHESMDRKESLHLPVHMRIADWCERFHSMNSGRLHSQVDVPVAHGRLASFHAF